MGTFEGHAIPSIIYSLLALWWGFVTSVKYARTQLDKRHATFRTSTAMPCFFCPTSKLRTFPIESCFKLTFLGIHTVVEIYTGLNFNQTDHMWHLGKENAHHVCMLSGFMLAALVEILIYYGLPLPKYSEFIFNGLGFLIQAIIMTTHLDGNEGVELTVHKLWTIIIVLTLVAGLVEIAKPDIYWPCMIRIAFFFTQGTWLMQVAFVVWPHTTNPRFLWDNSHESHVWLSISIMYHMLGCFCVLMIQYLIVFKSIECLDRHYTRYEHDMIELEKQIKHNSNHEDQIKLTNSREYMVLINEMDAEDTNDA